MKKFFVFSDVHSYYNELITALKDKGWDYNNPDHYLISCGDCFDRGNTSIEMMEFIKHAPRLITIRGNHEYLMDHMIARGYPNNNDIHNCTINTAMQLTHTYEMNAACALMASNKDWSNYYRNCVHYFETEHYIFCHGWIPVATEEDPDPKWQKVDKLHRPYIDLWNDNWRNPIWGLDWEDATWKCGPRMAKDGFNKTGKIIVAGHWHCSLAWALSDLEHYNEFPDCCSEWQQCRFDPCFFNNCWFIDACTVYTKKVNVLVLEDNMIGE